MKSLSTPGHKAVALINRTDRPLSLSVTLDELHLSLSSVPTVHDLWNGTARQLAGSSITVDLKPKETAFLRVEGKPAEDSIRYPDDMPARISVLEDGFKPSDRSVARQWIPARIGYLPDGSPLQIDAGHDQNSLGVAAGSRLRIDLNSEFRIVLLSPRSLSGAGGQYRIFADGRLLKKGQAGAAAVPLTLHVKNIRSLELIAPPATVTNTEFAWHRVSFKR